MLPTQVEHAAIKHDELPLSTVQLATGALCCLSAPLAYWPMPEAGWDQESQVPGALAGSGRIARLGHARYRGDDKWSYRTSNYCNAAWLIPISCGHDRYLERPELSGLTDSLHATKHLPMDALRQGNRLQALGRRAFAPLSDRG